MDNPAITTERESVPAWAKPESTKDAADPNRATEKQMNYIEGLLQERELARLSPEQLEFLNQDHLHVITKEQASRIIGALLKLPKKPRHEQEAAERQGRAEDIKWQQELYDLPAGRYAIENNDGELRFYKKWVSQDKQRFALYVQHGPDESNLPRPAQVAIAKKIMAAGVRQCAIRYGMEIGECSNCGRRLTNRISRELGIGPICGGRMFGDEFKVEVKQARAAITARGLDPNEDVD